MNEIFETLASNNSRNFKIDLLNDRKDDQLLKKIIFLALDPFTNFYQRKIPDYTPAKDNQADTLDSVIDSLQMLSTRKVTGNAAILHLTKLLSSLVESDAKVLERIIKKDLKCGVSISTANAVWPNLIHEYPCMLCSQYDDKLVKKIKFPAYVQMKMDGMRFNAIVRHTAIDSSVEFRSRNGKELNLLGNLDQEFIALSNGMDCVFDGELLVMSDDDYQFADRQTGNGILSKANKGTISQEEACLIHASIWDIIAYDDFVKGVSNIPYSMRWNTLTSLIDSQPMERKRIWLVYHQEVNTIDEANIIFKDLLANGHEGIILKDIMSIWEDRRSKSQIKFKGGEECDLKIVGIQPGTGKYEGMLGALICESADGILKVDVGSGFKDIQRQQFGEDLINKIVTVKYNMRIRNKQGEESLFLPVFVEVREDKDIANSINDIK